ncbi:MAG: (S)-ureidoglycine--glyoxylate transaminase [Chloroflexota bacterium]
MVLLAGGGPTAPDPRVILAQTTPVIGQFDPAFTTVMDDVMLLARTVFRTTYPRCFAISSLAAGGLEAVLSSFLEPDDVVAIGGSESVQRQYRAVAERYAATVMTLDDLRPGVKLVAIPHIDPVTGHVTRVADVATAAHALGAKLIVDATLSLGAVDVRVDDWRVDVCLAGVEYALGAPAGMTLVTYSPAMETLLAARKTPPRTSYLDLRQLQAYWSSDRLNHHTAPTTLVYGLREALRCVLEEGLPKVIERHAVCGAAVRDGLADQGLSVSGAGPYAIVELPAHVLAHSPEAQLRRRLRDQDGIAVTALNERSWRLGLLGYAARPDAVSRVLMAVARVLAPA